MLKAIFFDFGNTLIESDSSLDQFNRDYTWPKLQELGAQGTYKDFLSAKQQVLRKDVSNKSVQAIRPYSEVIPFFHLIVKQMGLDHVSVEKSREIEAAGWEQYKTYLTLFPGTVNALHWIHTHGLQLAVISNWFQQYILDYLDHLRILPLFDLVMTSEKAGANKFDLTPFQLTLDALYVNPKHSLHVGDNIIQDGACRKLGIRYVFSRWHQTKGPKVLLPVTLANQFDYQVISYPALVDLLESLL